MMNMRVGMVQINGGDKQRPADWEMRPGGMLVQRRNPDSDRDYSDSSPALRLRVKYGSSYHEISINPQSTFGELKKMLVGPTGLHHEDQKLIYQGKERGSKDFLDSAGLKDRSKIVLLEDPLSQERRYLETRRKAKMEQASRTISTISLEVDRLSGQVSALQSVVSKGGRVADKNVVNLIELLMNQLVRLDGIFADGEVKLQRDVQAKRIQTYVETLDVLKIKNSIPLSNRNQVQQRKVKVKAKAQEHRLSPIHEMKPGNSTPKDVVVTTRWETFDSTPSFLPASSTSESILGKKNANCSNFDWELFK